MNRNRKAIIDSNEVSEMLTLELGGIKQKVLIEGKKDTLPVVIAFHGGPGLPIPFNCGGRGLFKDYTDVFIMVYWDQYGCGINRYKGHKDHTIRQYIDMAEDLIHQIKKRFPKNKIILFGHAFGTVLTATAAKELKGEVDGVVAFGQNLKHVLFNKETLSALENSSISSMKLEKIRNLDKNHLTSKQLKKLMRLLGKYTNTYYHHRTGNKTDFKPFLRGMFQSPDYHFLDMHFIFHNDLRFNASLWSELVNLDLTDMLQDVEIPYLIIQGETDALVGFQTLKTFVEHSMNKNLYYYPVFQCGHVPNKQATDMACRTLRLLMKQLMS